MARTTIDELLGNARAGLVRVAPEEALAAQRAGALLVDVRSVDSRRRHGVIPGSLHVPLSVLPWRFDPASDWRSPHAPGLDRQVVVVCDHGYSSSLAAALLQQLGFSQATDLAGGFEAWRRAGLPVTEPAPPGDDLPGMSAPDA
jgi:rhodanese-related sulfurtransferase